MSNYVPTKQHLREVLLYLFNLKKNASEAHRLVSEAYPEYCPDVRMCQKWFARFKSGDFDIEDKERPGQPKKFDDEELEALIEQNASQTIQDLADSLNVTHAAVSKRLKTLGKIQKHGKWVSNAKKTSILSYKKT